MRVAHGLWLVLAAAALAGCATGRGRVVDDCSRRAAFQRGVGDGTLARSPGYGPPGACSAEASLLRQAYREGYESVRSRRLGAGRGPAGGRVADGYGLPSSRKAWVCEVEASEKIFTGIGTSQEEAYTLAHSTCSAHFQSSYCQKTECKANL